MSNESQDVWFSFAEKTPDESQAIYVRTFSGLELEAVYLPHLDLEGVCESWRPRQ